MSFHVLVILHLCTFHVSFVLHAFLECSVHFAFISSHFPVMLQAFPFTFLSFCNHCLSCSFHGAFISFHGPFILCWCPFSFLSLCIYVLSVSFRIALISTYCPLFCCHVLSFGRRCLNYPLAEREFVELVELIFCSCWSLADPACTIVSAHTHFCTTASWYSLQFSFLVLSVCRALSSCQGLGCQTPRFIMWVWDQPAECLWTSFHLTACPLLTYPYICQGVRSVSFVPWSGCLLLTIRNLARASAP